MSSPINSEAVGLSRAEKAFTEAFERLKDGRPERLPKDTPVSQNNVAKEAGCDPSALRKARYPRLIEDIQLWVSNRASRAAPSPRQMTLAKRRDRRSLTEKMKDLKTERDNALSLLLEADAKILELTLDNDRLQALMSSSNVVPMQGKKREEF